MVFVLDSSVILAIVRGEPGYDKAFRHAQEALMSAVNLSEVVTRCVEQSYPEEAALEVIQSCGIRVVALDEELAVIAGQLRRRVPKGTLSLGDRACIATAVKSGGVAVTADRIWTSFDLGCPIELIR